MYRFTSISLVVALIFFSTASSVLADTSETKKITDTVGKSYQPQVLVEDEVMYLVWTDDIDGNSEIYFTKSADQGKTFDAPKNLSNSAGDSAFPRIAVYHGKIFVSWYDYSPGQSDVFVAASLNDGNTFEVSNLSDNPSASYNPWISKTEKYLYVTWNDGGTSKEIQFANEKRIVDVLTGDSEILFARSSDDGHTYDIINISKKTGESLNPRLRVWGENVYVVWTEENLADSEVFFSASTDGGLTFGEPISISVSSSRSFDAGIEAQDNFVYLIWKENISNGTAVLFSRSIDNGKTFEKPINLSGSLARSAITRDTQIALDAQNIHVVYYTEDEGKSHTYISTSTDGGKTFGRSINLDGKNGGSSLAQAHIADKALYAVWAENISENSEIFLRASTDGGKTFGPLDNITNDPAGSKLSILGPQISSSKSNLFIVWENQTQGELYLATIQLQGKQAKSYELDLRLMTANVQVGSEMMIPNQTIPLSLSFYGPNDSLVENLDYAIIIKDEQGNVIDQQNRFSESGKANASVSFPKQGVYQISVQLPGSDNLQFNEDEAMLVSVVPEFGNAVVILVILLFSTLFYKSVQKYPRFNITDIKNRPY